MRQSNNYSADSATMSLMLCSSRTPLAAYYRYWRVPKSSFLIFLSQSLAPNRHSRSLLNWTDELRCEPHGAAER